MTSPENATDQVVTTSARKPLDEEIDVYGLTHTGKVRKVNQDHFLIASLRKHMQVHYTSLPDVDHLPLGGERVAWLAMVADGVGGGTGGEEASRVTIKEVSQYIARSMQAYYTADASDEAFVDALNEAAMQCHASVVQRAEDDSDRRRMATTLTLVIGVWPRAFLLQVGDSRCYLFRDGKLTQITRDQTMAEELIDSGVLSRSSAFNTRWANVLSSSIGGQQTAPVVTRFEAAWHQVLLLCSDGLTKHVSDDQIGECLGNMTSAKQVCEDLLQAALDDGGSDNVTIIVARAVHEDHA